MLAGLKSLSVVGFSRLPRALSTLTSLTELRLGNSQPSTFYVGMHGMHVLRQLPKLATLALPPLLAEDQRRVEQLGRERQLLVQIGRAGGHTTVCTGD